MAARLKVPLKQIQGYSDSDIKPILVQILFTLLQRTRHCPEFNYKCNEILIPGQQRGPIFSYFPAFQSSIKFIQQVPVFELTTSQS